MIDFLAFLFLLFLSYYYLIFKIYYRNCKVATPFE